MKIRTARLTSEKGKARLRLLAVVAADPLAVPLLSGSSGALTFSNPAPVDVPIPPPPANPALCQMPNPPPDCPTPMVRSAVPYPSDITVSSLSGTITDVNVTITNFSTKTVQPPLGTGQHYAEDADLLLVGPDGTAVMLMSDVGGNNNTSNAVTNLTVTFDDAAAGPLPEDTALPSNTSITARPTDDDNDAGEFSATDFFPAAVAPSPSPTNPTTSNTLLSAFNGKDPNGTWHLYLVDDTPGAESVLIAGGWTLELIGPSGVTTTTLPPTTTSSTTTSTSTTTTVPPTTTTSTSTTTTLPPTTTSTSTTTTLPPTTTSTSTTTTLPPTTTSTSLPPTSTTSTTAPPGGLTCFGLTPTIVGTEGNDTLVGTAGRDVIVARGGNDSIDGRGGDDLICAGDGDDSISGGTGNDTISGGNGNDNLVGSYGDDNLQGDAGNDNVLGGSGNDSHTGGAGTDICKGGDGINSFATCEIQGA